MTKFDPTQVEDLINKLRAPTYGHGAFGEPETYPPSERDLEIADILDWYVKTVDEIRVMLIISEHDEFVTKSDLIDKLSPIFKKL